MRTWFCKDTQRWVSEILKSPDFDYSRLEDESLEGVIDTIPICE